MSRKNPYYDPAKAHHRQHGFHNLDPMPRRVGDFQRWRAERKARQLPRPPVDGYASFAAQRWQAPDFSGEGDAAWWLGHASVLLRLGGRYVLTDPALSDRASPLPFVGPKRRMPPAATIDELPRIDVVLVSHSHYDHLDLRSVRRLVQRFPGVRFMVPLGLGAWVRARGARHVEEFDWWDAKQLDGARFTFVPAQHWSQRTLWDMNRSLWGGWVVQTGGFSFYFAGDTGYSPRLAEIGARLGPFDLAALPIGAYEPRWFMRFQHVDPGEAVRLHRELHCKRSFAIHWGAFELADDALDAAPAELAVQCARQGVPPARFQAINTGARIDIDVPALAKAHAAA